MTIVNKSKAAHYNWGDNCEGWRLVDTDKISVIEEMMPANTAELVHFHETADQVFYVLSGTLSIVVDCAEHVLTTGDALHILPGSVHEVRNKHAENVHFLVISTPSTKQDRVQLESTS